MKKYTFLILLIASVLQCAAQENDAGKVLLDTYTDSLKIICKKLYAVNTSDSDKKKYNRELIQTFERALKIEGSMSYPFDSLNDMARLTPPDRSFRIINWNVAYKDGTQEYFGFVQNKHVVTKKKGLFSIERAITIKIHPLIDKSLEIKNPENTVSDNKNWFGMLYYTVIPTKTKKKTYYTLLGWDGNDKFSKKKIIDILTFDDKGIPHFGADVFNIPKKNPKRVIFEYAADCTISLKYNSKKGLIVVDHLAPENPLLEGQFQYYCTDMSYDGFEFKKGKWNYIPAIDITNEKDPNDRFYNDPNKSKPVKGSNRIIPVEKPKQKK